MRKRIKEEDLPESYQLGKTERWLDISPSNCPYPTLSIAWSWYMAGWNDQDKEMNHERG